MQTDLRYVRRHAVLAAIGLSAAAWVWQSESVDKLRTGALPFAACAESALSEVSLKLGARRVAVRFRDEAATISLTRRVRQPAKGAAMPKEVTPTHTLIMGASKRVQRLRRRFAPAMAKRGLGKLDDVRRKMFGLTGSLETLHIRCGSEVQTFSVGTTSYGGSGRYIEHNADGSVWLVDPTLISDIRLADSRFVERRLVATAASELEFAEVRALGHAKKLLHRNRRVRKRSEWVAARSPDKRNELYGNWLNKVLKLRAISWLNGTPTAELDTITGKRVRNVRRVVSVLFSGAHSERVELWQGATSRSQGAKAKSTRLFWARSGATGGWVSVSRSLGEQLLADVAAVVEAPAGPTSK